MAAFYLVLAIVGAIAPYIFFLDFMAESGVGLGPFVGALFVNGAAGGFATDLVISSTAFWAFLWNDAGRSNVAHPWIYVLVNLLIGLSCALPLYLYMRERRALAPSPA